MDITQKLIHSLLTDKPQSIKTLESNSTYTHSPIRIRLKQLAKMGKADFVMIDNQQHWFKCNKVVEVEVVEVENPDLLHVVMCKRWDANLFQRV